jgi:hypothetical protein
MRGFRLIAAALAVAAGLAVGCSGGKEKGKNQDFDLPRPTSK